MEEMPALDFAQKKKGAVVQRPYRNYTSESRLLALLGSLVIFLTLFLHAQSPSMPLRMTSQSRRLYCLQPDIRARRSAVKEFQASSTTIFLNVA